MSSSGVGASGVGDYNPRHAMDMDQLDSEDSEFSWGPGLAPRGLENAQPSQGGRYRGQTPPCPSQVGVSRH